MAIRVEVLQAYLWHANMSRSLHASGREGTWERGVAIVPMECDSIRCLVRGNDDDHGGGMCVHGCHSIALSMDGWLDDRTTRLHRHYEWGNNKKLCVSE